VDQRSLNRGFCVGDFPSQGGYQKLGERVWHMGKRKKFHDFAPANKSRLGTDTMTMCGKVRCLDKNLLRGMTFSAVAAIGKGESGSQHNNNFEQRAQDSLNSVERKCFIPAFPGVGGGGTKTRPNKKTRQ